MWWLIVAVVLSVPDELQQRFERQLQAITSQQTKDGFTVEVFEQQFPVPPVELAPVPDVEVPVSVRPPVIEWAASAAVSERLPRGVLLTGKYCAPCERVKAENPDLIGGPESPIEVIDDQNEVRLRQLGIVPGMWSGNPCLVILGADGKLHDSRSTRFGCFLQGYQSPAAIRSYLTSAEHGVSLAPAVESSAVAVCDSPAMRGDVVAAVLSAHLLRYAGEQPTEPVTFGSLIEIEFDAPESVLSIARRLLIEQRIELPASGLSIDWTGDKRTFSVTKDSLTLSPGIGVTVRKFGLRKSATLKTVRFTRDLRSISLELDGLPDVTVKLR